MTEGLQVSDSTPAMRVQRNHFSRRNAGMKNAHTLVFQQQLMMGRRGCERVERVWPRPLLRVLRKRILAHAVIRKLKCSISRPNNIAIIFSLRPKP